MPIGRAGLRAYGPGVPSRRLIDTGAVALIATGTGVAIQASDAGQEVYSRIDATFGDTGYAGDFPNSTDSGYKFTSLCIDPGSALGYKPG
jgi:hypothetical protein